MSSFLFIQCPLLPAERLKQVSVRYIEGCLQVNYVFHSCAWDKFVGTKKLYHKYLEDPMKF